MAIGGSWATRYANAQAYTGARRWGTGYNPIHEVRDNPGRVTGVKGNLFPLGEPSDSPPESILGPDDYVSADWDGEGSYPDEVFRYQDERPRWDQVTPQFRDESNSAAMGEQPPWGVYNDANPVDGWPLPGPTGGMDPYLDVHHGENTERQHAIAVPTRGLNGGWLNKARGAVARAEYQDPGDPGYQLAINTSGLQGQGVKSRGNERAVARGTDAAREPIQSRTAGMVLRQFAQSFGMGGGAGTPDMQPFQQTAGLKRPFVPRKAGLPPFEEHTWNEMEGRMPIQRTVPPDPYQGDPETAGTTGGTDAIYDMGEDVDWGY
jgi:hypothetical protein